MPDQPEEFEGRDLSDAVFWGVDLSRATLRDVNFTGASMRNVWLVDVQVDGLVQGLVVNGVDVTDYVNQHDPWWPLRGMLRPTDTAGLLATCDALDAAWATVAQQARALPDQQRHASVDGEWSVVQTLRHLVFAIDKWFTAPILGQAFHPMGLPNTGSRDFPWPGLDPDAAPSFDDAVAAHTGRVAAVRRFAATMADTDVHRPIDVLENGTVPLIECLYTVFEEEFEHHRYALRDLAVLAG